MISTGLEQLGINTNNPFMMIINGKTGSGKSLLLRYLMREINKENPFDYGIVFSNTAWEGSFDYIPHKYIHETYNESIVKNIIGIQKQNLKKSNNKIKKAFIILDDCCSENEFKSPLLKKLAIMGRHYNITTFLTTQYCNKYLQY